MQIDIDARVTAYVVMSCVIAAFGGILFGYDAGTDSTHCRMGHPLFVFCCVVFCRKSPFALTEGPAHN